METLSQETAKAATAANGLGFTCTNTNGDAIIYITNDPSLNILTLTMSNNTDNTITLKGGEPVAEESLNKRGPSSLYLYFSFEDQFTTDILQQIHIKCAGWKAQFFDGRNPAWALTPQQDIDFAKDDVIEFSINNISGLNKASSGNINIDYNNISEIINGSTKIPLSIASAPSPELKNLNDTLCASFTGDNTIFITDDTGNPISNELVLSLSNASSDMPLTDSWDESYPPIFNISFVYDTNNNSYGALTTPEQGSDISINIAQTYTNDWKLTPHTNDETPRWELTPSTSNQEILGTGVNASLDIHLSNIITQMPIGTTLLYLNYSNIPGYNDGCYTLQIEKKIPTPGILNFTGYPANITSGESINLSWQTFAAHSVKLTYLDLNTNTNTEINSANGDIDVNQSSYPLTPIDNTTYTLYAYDKNGQLVNEDSQFTVTVSQPLPEITFFNASPGLANLSKEKNSGFPDGTGETTLSWKVTNSDNIDDLYIDQNIGTVKDTDSCVTKITEPTTFTITVVAKSNPYSPISSKTVSVGTYTEQYIIPPGGFLSYAATYSPANFKISPPCSIAIKPDNSLLYVSFYNDEIMENETWINYPMNQFLAEVSTDIFEPPTRGSMLFGQPYTIAISPDGSTLYAAIWAPMPAIAGIDTSKNEIKTEFQSKNTPYAIAISTDGKVYASEANIIEIFDPEQNPNESIGEIQVSGSNLLTISPDASRLYSLNYSNVITISTIDLTKKNTPVIHTLSIDDHVWSFCLSPDGTRLYLGQDDCILVIDTTSYNKIANIPIKRFAAALASSPEGSQLYVSNYDNNLLSVIDTNTNSVIAEIPQGDCPFALAVYGSSDSQVDIYVANFGDASGDSSIIKITISNT